MVLENKRKKDEGFQECESYPRGQFNWDSPRYVYTRGVSFSPHFYKVENAMFALEYQRVREGL